ncbi:hypothetical protein V6N12_025606 [Hibiscus sabdariffa]|uniref:RNase H type-1 domain-containing protein n=1 Tax=Hibiscus sabdariffa TaxID=183260 RepID=A0ABR2CIY6_9ROSI
MQFSFRAVRLDVINSSLLNQPLPPIAFTSVVSEPVEWQPGPINSCTLNSDGAVNLHTSMGSTGGLLHNHFGNWLIGSNKKARLSSPLQAEILGIYVGFRLAWDNDYKHVQVQSDLSEALNLISSPLAESDACAVVRAIAQLVKRH